MNDLTQAEHAELSGEIERFVQDMALVGLAAIVIVNGRGACKLGYAREIGPLVGSLLDNAVESHRKHNAREAN